MYSEVTPYTQMHVNQAGVEFQTKRSFDTITIHYHSNEFYLSFIYTFN